MLFVILASLVLFLIISLVHPRLRKNNIIKGLASHLLTSYWLMLRFWDSTVLRIVFMIFFILGSAVFLAAY